MRKKYFAAVLVCVGCLTFGAASAGVVGAEEATETEEAAETETEAADSDVDSSVEEQSEEAETEAETETEMERPDYTALDYVTLGEYQGLTVTLTPEEITDEDVQKQAEDNIRVSGLVELETITEGTVQDGDTATIDFEGKQDGVAFDGGTSKDYDLVIGSGSFIDGFEEGLIGVAVGETVDLNLTFPENYYSEDLAGQDVVFTVTVNQIQRLPELTDDVVSQATDGEYTDLASYLSYVRTSMEEDAESEKQANIVSELYTQIYNSSEITGYPQEMVDYSTNQATSYYRQMAEAYSMEYEDLIALYGYTEEEFNEELDQMVKSSLEQEMLLRAIAEQEEFEISDEEYETGAAEYAEQYGYDDTEEFVEAYGGEKSVRLGLLLDKVITFLEDSANVIEETEAESESESGSEDSAIAGEETETGSEGESGSEDGAIAGAEAETEAESEGGSGSEDSAVAGEETETEAVTE